MLSRIPLFATVTAGFLASLSLPAQTPSAPAVIVPAAVALNRPTPDEVARINDALTKALIQASPGVKEIFDKYPNFKLVTYVPNSAIVPAPFNPPRHDANVVRAKQGDIDLLLAGDSITDWWQTNGRAQYANYFGGVKVADFAITGDTTQGVLFRLQNGEGQGFQPKAIMLMIGTNNLARNTPAEIAEGVGADIAELRKDFPDAKILLLAVFPRGVAGDPSRAAIADINKIIAKLDDGKNVFFLDIGAGFLGPDGNFKPGTFRTDNLHPAGPGYEIWGEAVKEPLSKMLGTPIPAPAPAAAPAAVPAATGQ